MELWKNVLWSDVTKLKLFGPMDQRYVCCKRDKAHKQKNTISIVKLGGGSVLLWGCFTVAGSGNHDCMKDIMDSLKCLALDVQKLPRQAKAQQQAEIHRLGNRHLGSRNIGT